MTGIQNIGRVKLITALLVLLAGLRYRIGTDSISYEFWFNNNLPTIDYLDFKSIFDDFVYEPLFVIYASLVKSIFNDWVFFQFVTSLIINVVILRFIYNNSKYFFTTVLIYFVLQYYTYNCESIRATLSICMFLLALPYLEKKEWIRYYSLIIVGVFFHYSSAILLFLPFLRKIKADSKIAIITYTVLFLCGASARAFYSNISAYLVLMSGGFSGATRMDRYQDGFYMSDTINFNTLIVSLVMIIAFIIAIKYIKKCGINIPYEYTIFIFLCFEVLKINLGIFYRFSMFFTILAYITYSLAICSTSKNIYTQIPKICIYLILLLEIHYMIKVELAPNIKQTDVYIPYNSVLMPYNNAEREAIYRTLDH